MSANPFDWRRKPWWQRKSYTVRTVNIDDPSMRDLSAMARLFGLRLKISAIPFGGKGAWFKHADGRWHRTHVDHAGNATSQIGPRWR